MAQITAENLRKEIGSVVNEQLAETGDTLKQLRQEIAEMRKTVEKRVVEQEDASPVAGLARASAGLTAEQADAGHETTPDQNVTRGATLFAQCTRIAARSRARGKNIHDAAKELAELVGGGARGRSIVTAARAMSEDSGPDGGFLVSPEIAREIIPYLRSETVVDKLGPQYYNMKNNVYSIPAITGTSTCQWVGETTAPTPTQPSFGNVVLNAKKNMALVPVPDDLLHDFDVDGEQTIKDDVFGAMALFKDSAYVRGAGTEFTPRGMRNQALTSAIQTTNWLTETNNATGANNSTITEIITDLGRAVLALRKNKVQFRRPAWILSSTAHFRLTTATATTGVYLFRDEMANGTLLGYPFVISNEIPITLSSPVSVRSSEVYFVEMSNIAIGNTLDFTVDTFRGGAYTSGGSVVSGISTNSTVIRAIERTDIQDRYQGKSIAVILNTWGC